MVGADGRVKVLDFGLAKLMDVASVDMGVTGLPTAALTDEGRIVGTVAYMSPEQAEGKPFDQTIGHLLLRRDALRDGDRCGAPSQATRASP